MIVKHLINNPHQALNICHIKTWACMPRHWTGVQFLGLQELTVRSQIWAKFWNKNTRKDFWEAKNSRQTKVHPQISSAMPPISTSILTTAEKHIFTIGTPSYPCLSEIEHSLARMQLRTKSSSRTPGPWIMTTWAMMPGFLVNGLWMRRMHSGIHSREPTTQEVGLLMTLGLTTMMMKTLATSMARTSA